MSEMTALYTMLESAPFCIRQVAGSRMSLGDGGMLRIKLQPVGVQTKPTDSASIIQCLTCLLQAVRFVHGQGWSHSDIRWPNVIRTEDSWCLIDFENASPSASAEQQRADVAALCTLFAQYTQDMPALADVLSVLGAQGLDAGFGACKGLGSWTT